MFPCTKCGQCCLNIKGIPELDNYHNGNGICIQYDSNIGCTIYHDRPLHCRIDDGFKLLFSSKFSKKEFNRMNAKVCNQLQEKAGIDEHYRIKIDG